MSDIRNSPSSIVNVTGETISWFIDRIGDRSDDWDSNIIRNNVNIFNNLSSVAATYPTNYDYNYINYHYRNDTLINYSRPSIRAIPSELVLDQDIKFNEEQCECCICMEQKEEENICQFNCGHVFCVTCIDRSLKTFRDRNQDVICALCRTEVKKITFKKQENRDKIQEYL
jgi:hypothetical protein